VAAQDGEARSAYSEAGVDVDAGAEPTDLADPNPLTCRVYRRRDGRISPTPDPDDLREALGRAARVEVTPT